MKLYDLLRTMTFKNFIVMLNVPDIPYPTNNLTIYHWEENDREVMKPYLDYEVSATHLLDYGYDSKKTCFMIVIKGQKIV